MGSLLLAILWLTIWAQWHLVLLALALLLFLLVLIRVVIALAVRIVVIRVLCLNDVEVVLQSERDEIILELIGSVEVLLKFLVYFIVFVVFFIIFIFFLWLFILFFGFRVERVEDVEEGVRLHLNIDLLSTSLLLFLLHSRIAIRFPLYWFRYGLV